MNARSGNVQKQLMPTVIGVISPQLNMSWDLFLLFCRYAYSSLPSADLYENYSKFQW